MTEASIGYDQDRNPKTMTLEKKYSQILREGSEEISVCVRKELILALPNAILKFKVQAQVVKLLS